MDRREDETQIQDLTTECGVAGSGLVRYAAAMYFFQIGKINKTTLEAYRALAKDDNGDPQKMVIAKGGDGNLEELIRRKASYEKSS